MGAGALADEQWRSSDAGFFAVGGTYANRDNGARDTAVRQVLADNANAKAWLSAHTHSPLNAPNFVQGLSIGGRIVAQANASSIYYVGKTQSRWNPIQSVYVTLWNGDIQVRIRDHGAGVWQAINRARITTVTPG